MTATLLLRSGKRNDCHKEYGRNRLGFGGYLKLLHGAITQFRIAVDPFRISVGLDFSRSENPLRLRVPRLPGEE